MSRSRLNGRRTAKSAVVTNLSHKHKANSYEIAVRLGVVGCDLSRSGPFGANAKAEASRAIRAKHKR